MILKINSKNVNVVEKGMRSCIALPTKTDSYIVFVLDDSILARLYVMDYK